MKSISTPTAVAGVFAILSSVSLLSLAHAQTAGAMPLETATVESARAPLERIYDGTCTRRRCRHRLRGALPPCFST